MKSQMCVRIGKNREHDIGGMLGYVIYNLRENEKTRILLFAEDTKIKDPKILNQINSILIRYRIHTPI